MDTPGYDVFLSRNSADKPDVVELALRLSAERILPRLDKRNLIPGAGKFLPSVREVMSELKADVRQLHWTARKAPHEAPESQRVFLLLYQFEEIFTLCQDNELRRAYIDNVLYAAAVFNGRTIVVLTLRADFISFNHQQKGGHHEEIHIRRNLFGGFVFHFQFGRQPCWRNRYMLQLPAGMGRLGKPVKGN